MAKPEKTVPAAQADTTGAVVNPAAQEQAAAPVPTAPAAPQFKIKKILTLPLLKLQPGVPVHVRVESAVFLGKAIAAAPGQPAKEPPHMWNITDLVTGEQMQMMLGAVLCRLLDEEYPAQSYVGKGFMITLNEQKRGRGAQNYNTYSLSELEI